jgi:ribosomal protein S18 acetylase RimI-like enzyme
MVGMDMVIRRATPADASGLVVLRACMFDAMGESTETRDPWRKAFISWVEASLATRDAAAFVAEHPAVGLVSTAMGEITRKPPSPHNLHGISGHISNVVTLPDWRGQGLARSCVLALVDWFRTETDVRDIDLNATAEASDLYHSLGFRLREYPSMRLVVQ